MCSFIRYWYVFRHLITMHGIVVFIDLQKSPALRIYTHFWGTLVRNLPFQHSWIWQWIDMKWFISNDFCDTISRSSWGKKDWDWQWRKVDLFISKPLSSMFFIQATGHINMPNMKQCHSQMGRFSLFLLLVLVPCATTLLFLGYHASMLVSSFFVEMLSKHPTQKQTAHKVNQ